MMTQLSATTGFHPVYRDRLLMEREHDSYKIKGKLHEPTVCPTCRAVYVQGRWQWASEPPGAIKHTCPACMRIHDHYPAGFVSLSGSFFEEHRAEIMALLRAVEKREREQDPLKRIMAEEKHGDGILVTTTDLHLARLMGEAIQAAYQGELEFKLSPRRHLVQVNWTH